MNYGFQNKRDFAKLFNNKYLHELDDNSRIFLMELFGNSMYDDVPMGNQIICKIDT